MSARDLSLVLLVCVVWALNFISGAKGMQAFPPMLFMVMRFLIVLALTLPFLRLPPPGQWLRLASVCLFMGGLHFTFLFWALKLSADVTSIAILQNMYIPIAVLLAILFLGEKAGWRTLGSTAMAFAGVLVIGFDPLVLSQLNALGLILLSACCQAIASVLMRGLHGMGPMNFQGWTALFALPVLALASWLFESNQWAAILQAQPGHWAALCYSAVVASLVGHGLFFVLVQRNPLPKLMPYMLLMPVLAALFGVLIWGDRPGPRLLLGGGLVLLGILFITLRGRTKARALAVDPE